MTREEKALWRKEIEQACISGGEVGVELARDPCYKENLEGKQDIMTEDYCSYEVAKILKEKAFNESCYTCYVEKEISHYDYSSANYELIDGVISCPTIQMAMKWLREVHNIDICVFPYQFDYIGYSYEVKIYKNKEMHFRITDSKTYEEAVEVALKYTLECLI